MAHRLEFLLSAFKPAFKVGDGSAGVFEVKAHIFAGFLVVLELQPAVGPESDFLGEPFVDGGKGLVHMGNAASGDFLKVFWNERVAARARAVVPGQRRSRGRRADPCSKLDQ